MNLGQKSVFEFNIEEGSSMVLKQGNLSIEIKDDAGLPVTLELIKKTEEEHTSTNHYKPMARCFDLAFGVSTTDENFGLPRQVSEVIEKIGELNAFVLNLDTMCYTMINRQESKLVGNTNDYNFFSLSNNHVEKINNKHFIMDVHRQLNIFTRLGGKKLMKLEHKDEVGFYNEFDLDSFVLGGSTVLSELSSGFEKLYDDSPNFGLIIKPSILYPYSVENPELQIEYDVTEEGLNKFVFKLDSDSDLILDKYGTEELSISRQGFNCEVVCTDDEVQKLPHELAALYLFGETDKRISLIGDIKGEINNRKTPDWVSRSNKDSDNSLVVEIKTTSKPYEPDSDVKNAMEIESHKYVEAIDIRLRGGYIQKATYCTMLIFSNGILTNMFFNTDIEPTDLLLTCHKFYKIGWMMKNKFLSVGRRFRPLIETEKVNEMIDSMNGVELTESESPLIDQRMISYWDADLTIERKKELIGMLVDNGKKRLNNLVKNERQKATSDNDWIKYQIRNKALDCRSDKKPVSQLPLVVLDNLKVFKIDQPIDISLLYGRLWKMAFNEYMNNPQMFDYISTDLRHMWALRNETYEGLDKRDRNKVDLALSDADIRELAQSGINGKKYSEVDLEKKKPFSIDTDVEDIEKFCNSSALFEDSGRKAKGLDSIVKLIQKGCKLAGNDLHELNSIRTFLDTKLGMALLFIEEIIQEVNISRNQNVTSKTEFRLKKLQHFPAMLLIKPTKATNHIFFSICIESSSVLYKETNTCIKNFMNIGSYECTKFISLDQHRITNLLFLPFKIYCHMVMWSQNLLPGLGGIMSETLKGTYKIVNSHVMTYLISKLEDSEHTSADMLQARYAYMDAIKGMLINPHKIFKKMDEFPRSRLQIYYYLRLARVCDLHVANPPKFELMNATDDSVDMLTDCYSWISMEEMLKMRVLLDTCYFGVFHNKDEGDELHGYFKIFSKVIKEELKMKEARPEQMGFGSLNIGELRDHEFNADFARLMGENLRDNLRSRVGNLELWFKTVVLSECATQNLLELATFKASASKVEDHTYASRLAFKNAGKRTVESSKCLKNCLDLIRENSWIGVNFLVFIGELIKMKEQYRTGLRAYLFKKLQLGGVREIFVLDFVSRLIVYFSEYTARILCSQIDGEMQTHSHDKLSRVNSHFVAVKNLRKSQNVETTSVYNSDDNTTWCQRFVMPLFGAVMSKVLPEPFRTTMMKVFNMCTEKKLQLPIELLEKFSDHPEIRSQTDDGLNTLKEQFLGIDHESQKLIDAGGTMLYNTSNFMQGIFHYCSSLVHASYMITIQQTAQNVIKSKNMQGEVSWMVSSDDSWMATTIAHDPYEKETATYLATLVSCIKTANYPLMCAANSEEKSTSPTISPVMEFNSIWFANASVLSMSIKFIESCVRVASVSRMDDRQNTFSTLRSQLLQNSGSIELCNSVQLCQSFAHYMTLGGYIEPLFELFSDILVDKPHPSAGFFLFEPELTVGMLGMSFAMFTACTNDEDLLRYHLKLLTDKDAEIDELGQVRTKVYLPFGQAKRYRKFLSEINYDPKFVRDTFNENPLAFVDSPKTVDELKARMMEKCSDPSVADSFTFNTDSKLHASSSYILSARCLTIKMKSVEQIANEKITLVSYIDGMQKFQGEINRSHMIVLFSNLDFFTEFLESVNKLKAAMGGTKILVMSKRARTKLLTISIPKNVREMPVSLMTALRKIWFNQDSVSSDLATRVFEYYRTVFPWLKDTLNNTLESGECPFDKEDGVRLIKFIKSMEQSSRTVAVITSARNTIGKTDSLLEVVKNSQLPETEIKLGTEASTLSSVGKRVTVNLLKYYQYNVASAPPTVDKKSLLMQLIKRTPLQTDNTRDLISFMQTHDEIESRLELFKYLVKYPGAPLINLACASSQRGSVGWFSQEQKFNSQTNKWEGSGLFTGVISGVPYQVNWDSKSNAKLLIGSTSQLEKIKKDLKPLLKGLEIEPNRLASNNYIDIISMRSSSINTGNCIPVYEKQISPDTTIDTNYRIEINDKTEICLVTDSYKKQIVRGRLTSENKVVTLMKVKPRGDTIVKSPDDKEKLSIDSLEGVDLVTYSWINSKPVPLMTALSYIERISKDSKAWAENSLRLRLEQKNIRPIAFLRQEPILDEDVQSIASDDLSDFNEMNMSEMLLDPDKLMEEDEEDELIAELKNQDLTDYDGLYSMIEEDQMLTEEFAETRRKTDVFQPERKNKFWDGFIEKLVSTTGLELISQIMSTSDAYSEVEIESLNRYSRAFYAIMRGSIEG